MIEATKHFFNDYLGDKHELNESIELAINDRLVSPFYGYFLISWLILNWDFIYSALFVDQDKIYGETSLLRNDYLFQVILPTHYSVEYFLQFIIFPFILTCFVFWTMPIITNIFFRKYIRNKKTLETIRIQENAAKSVAEKQLIKAETEKAKAEKEATKVSPEIIWDKEYEKFKVTALYKKFYTIADAIYKFGGNYTHPKNIVDTDILIYSDTQGLTAFSEDEQYNRIIVATEKGKYFLGRFIQDPNAIRVGNIPF